MRVPISLYSHQHLLLPVFFIIARVSVKWYLIVVLHFSSEYCVEHLFMCLLAHCISCYENIQILCSLLSFVVFFIIKLEEFFIIFWIQTYKRYMT